MTSETNGERIDLLLVERPHDNRRCLANAFAETAARTVRTAADGEAAIDAPLRDDESDSAPLADLVVTNVAPAAVFDFLEAVRSETEIARIPVLVVLDADDDAAVTRAYDLGANACLDRASDPSMLASATEAFWLAQTKLPSRA